MGRLKLRDRTLRRWLRTGRPARVSKRLDDPDVLKRLDLLTALDAREREALNSLTQPTDGFEERVAAGVAGRADNETAGLLLDLIGLGWHTVTAVVEPPDNSTS